jgi:predicted kinase
LAGLEAWRRLEPTERSLVFAATLFHDVAKPLCTREEIGRLTARGHARRGARLARLAIWRGDAADACHETPLAVREGIVGLVRHHGLPLSWLHWPDPSRRLIEASFACRLDWLAVLAEADVRGRACVDRAGLLDRVALFRELAAEAQCLDRPRNFASSHTRFLYFRGRALCPDEPAFDDTRGEVILMSGLPGAGKDTWIERNAPGLPVIGLDEIRKELGIAPEDDQGGVANMAKARAKSLLRSGTPFVWNATNLSRGVRDALVGLFSGYGARVAITYVEAPWAVLVRRNRGRARPVPLRVLDSLGGKLDIPSLVEAHDVVWSESPMRGGS